MPNGILTKFSVKGLITKAKNKTLFNTITGSHFFLTRKPKATAFTKAGRKSRPRNIGGFALIAVKVPIITLVPPMYGPSIMPYRGARISESEKVTPATPIMGTVGIILRTAYIAENIAVNAICRVLIFKVRFIFFGTPV